jgi:DNA-binding NtrC family response regulator
MSKANHAPPWDKRPVLFPVATVGEQFVVSDGPIDLSLRPSLVVLGRTANDAQLNADANADSPSRITAQDPWLSREHAQLVMQRQPTRVVVEDLGSRNGIHVNGARTKRATLVSGDILEAGRSYWWYQELPVGDDVGLVRDGPVEFGGVATWLPSMGRTLQALRNVASSGQHLLLCGASGTGKGFLARTLHQQSRRLGKFVHFDARGPHLRQASLELLGDKQMRGRLSDAHGGTLLLEHVEALSLEDQERLALWLVRQRQPEKTRPIDVRVVATTTMAAADAVAAQVLLPALLALFDGHVHALPRLQQRRCDVGLLLEHSVAKHRAHVSSEAFRAILQYDYPEHVRGLMRVMDAALSLTTNHDDATRTITTAHLPVLLHQRLQQAADLELTGEGMAVTVPPSPPALASSLQSLPDELGGSDSAFPAAHEATVALPPRMKSGTLDGDALRDALQAARGNVAFAAAALGQPRARLLQWIDELDIDLQAFRKPH